MWHKAGTPPLHLALTSLQWAIVVLFWHQPTWLSRRTRSALRTTLQSINPHWDTHDIGRGVREIRQLQAHPLFQAWDMPREAQDVEATRIYLADYYGSSKAINLI